MPTRRTGRNADIIIADSEDETPLVVSSRNVPRSSSKRKKLPLLETELIEILSSDEENQPRKRQATVPPKDQLKQLHVEIRKLKQKCAKLDKVEGELEQARKENGELKLASKRSGKVLLVRGSSYDHWHSLTGRVVGYCTAGGSHLLRNLLNNNVDALHVGSVAKYMFSIDAIRQ
jgi:hypothetical protein